MNKITLSTLATLIALSPALAPAAFAGNRDNGKAVCNSNGRCVQTQKSHKTKSHVSAPKRTQKHVTNTRVTRKTVHVTQKAKTHRALPGRNLTVLQQRNLPRLPKGQVYRVVDNRVMRVDQDTAVIVASLGLLTALLAR